MVKGYIVLSVLMALLLYFGQPEAVDFYPLINKKEKTNCPVKENNVNLVCETEDTVSEMIIKRTHEEKVLNKSRGVNSTQYRIKQVECRDMGEYQCIIGNTHIETTALVLSDYEVPPSQRTTTATYYPKVEQELHLEDEEDKETRENIITFLPPFLVIAGAVVLTVVMIIRKEKRKKQQEAVIPSSNEQIITDSTNL